MANFKTDSRIVLTLDAGGTNMVFGAMKGGEYVGEPITLPSNSNNLDLCLQTMVLGFSSVINTLTEKPVAISFAFPGPADYPNGIIGGYLPNFPSFRDGVALGPFLQDKFHVPVFINNDGDLYAYGEALGGVLPQVNEKLAALGSAKRYHNLIGYTFGTGFGIGTVIDGELNRGDNSCVETFCLPHSKLPEYIVEDGVAIRAVKRVYGELSGNPNHGLEPKDIAAICNGEREGNKKAATEAFNEMGEVAGAAMATAATLIDGLIVIGGGIMNNYKYIMPGILKSMRATIKTMSGDTINRVQSVVYNLDDPDEFAKFAKGDARKLKVYGSEREVVYDPQKRIGVMRSRIGASKAISIGAYMFALNQLTNK
ncbi:MAG: ROK family protein [Bacteroidales bacterium]